MGAHIGKNGCFQSDKYPSTPPDLVPLKVTDPTAQDLLWEYAQRRRKVDEEFSEDLETVLRARGFQKRPRFSCTIDRQRGVLLATKESADGSDLESIADHRDLIRDGSCANIPKGAEGRTWDAIVALLNKMGISVMER